MLNLTNGDLEKILSGSEKADGHNPSKLSLTAEEFYAGISDKPFDSLSAEEKFIYDLIAQATNEVLAEYEKEKLLGNSHKCKALGK